MKKASDRKNTTKWPTSNRRKTWSNSSIGARGKGQKLCCAQGVVRFLIGKLRRTSRGFDWTKKGEIGGIQEISKHMTADGIPEGETKRAYPFRRTGLRPIGLLLKPQGILGRNQLEGEVKAIKNGKISMSKEGHQRPIKNSFRHWNKWPTIREL